MLYKLSLDNYFQGWVSSLVLKTSLYTDFNFFKLQTQKSAQIVVYAL